MVPKDIQIEYQNIEVFKIIEYGKLFLNITFKGYIKNSIKDLLKCRSTINKN